LTPRSKGETAQSAAKECRELFSPTGEGDFHCLPARIDARCTHEERECRGKEASPLLKQEQVRCYFIDNFICINYFHNFINKILIFFSIKISNLSAV